MVLELLLADLPEQGHKWLDDDAAQPHGELSDWAARLGVTCARRSTACAHAARGRSVAPGHGGQPGCLHPVQPLRARLPREQVNDVIGYAGRGAQRHRVRPGRCHGRQQLRGLRRMRAGLPHRRAQRQDPHRLAVVDRRWIRSARSAASAACSPTTSRTTNASSASTAATDRPTRPPVRQGALRLRLCAPPQRLTRPLIRKPGVAKDGAGDARAGRLATVFREASWDEALDLAAGGSRPCATQHGPKALAGFGSAKGSNEEAYLFQKLVRTGFGSNNVDHCTRLCHASSVAALLEGVGSGAVSNPVNDVEHAELILVIGSNPHGQPPGGRHLDEERRQRGAKIVLADPRAPTIGATPGACCSSSPTPTWRCSTR
jgi:formate dehydrogenase major subunit